MAYDTILADENEKAQTLFISFFTPEEMLALASEVGFKEAENVLVDNLGKRYFVGRTDNLSLQMQRSF